MYRKWLSLLLLCFCIMPLLAQETDADLIAFFNDQVYILENDELIPYDTCTPDETVVDYFLPSPDGTRFLIATRPKILTQILEDVGSTGGAPFGANYWICDTVNDIFERVITQPNADDEFDGEYPPLEEIMGRVVWSPDGTKLAWTSRDPIEEIQSIAILDLETVETTYFVIDVPVPFGPVPSDMLGWTEHGVVLWASVFDEITFLNPQLLVIVDPETQSLTASYEVLSGGEDDDVINQRSLVSTADATQYAVEFAEQGWMLINLIDGEMIPTSGRLGLAVLDNPDSVVLAYEQNFDPTATWEFEATDGDLITLRSYPSERVALSPDGTQVAYADSILYIVNQAGDTVDITNSDGFADGDFFRAQLIWGAKTVVFVAFDELELAPPASCEGAPIIQVIAGDTARIISETIPNRIRSMPTTNSLILGEIPARDEFIIRDGPVCAEGYTWFQIEYNGIIGWTVEGTGNSYFIEPVNALP